MLDNSTYDGKAQGTERGLLLLGMLYNHVGELSAMRILKYNYSYVGDLEKGNYIITRIWNVVVEDDYDLLFEFPFYLTLAPFMNTNISPSGILSTGTGNDNYYYTSYNVSVFNGEDKIVGKTYYQLITARKNFYCVLNPLSVMLLVSPNGDYVFTTAHKVTKLLKSMTVENKDIEIGNLGCDLSTHVGTYAKFNRDIAVNYDDISATAAELSMFSDLITTVYEHPVISKLPNTPFMIFPPNIPSVSITTSSACKCTQVRFPEEVHSNIAFTLGHNFTKLILPKVSTQPVSLNLMLGQSLDLISFPEKCREFKLGYFPQQDTESVVFPLVLATRNVYIALTNIKHAECTIAKKLIFEYKLPAITANTNIPDDKIIFETLRVHSNAPIDVTLDLSSITALQVSPRAFTLDLDYVDVLSVSAPDYIRDLYIYYSQINTFRPSMSSPLTRVHFICKQGGVPIKKQDILSDRVPILSQTLAKWTFEKEKP